MESEFSGSVDGKPLRINSSTLSGVMWGGGVFAVIFVSLRTRARIKSVKRLYWDDFFVFVAVILYIVIMILWQTLTVHDMYETMSVSAGFQRPGPDFEAHALRFYQTTIASTFLFYSTLWVLKFSFLIFFRRLGKNVERQKLLWWLIFGYTVITYLVAFCVTSYRYFWRFSKYITQIYSSESVAKSDRTMLICFFVFDVSTDIAIMLIPITMLWGVQMKLSKKLALAGIFSLVIVTIIIATVRILAITSWTGLRDPTLVYLWSVIEVLVALIISCVAPFRGLFVNRNTRPDRVRNIPPSKHQRLAEQRDRRPRDPYSLAGIFTNISALRTHVSSRDPEESSSQVDQSLEDEIRVEHEVDLAYETPRDH